MTVLFFNILQWWCIFTLWGWIWCLKATRSHVDLNLKTTTSHQVGYLWQATKKAPVIPASWWSHLYVNLDTCLGLGLLLRNSVQLTSKNSDKISVTSILFTLSSYMWLSPVFALWGKPLPGGKLPNERQGADVFIQQPERTSRSANSPCTKLGADHPHSRFETLQPSPVPSGRPWAREHAHTLHTDSWATETVRSQVSVGFKLLCLEGTLLHCNR